MARDFYDDSYEEYDDYECESNYYCGSEWTEEDAWDALTDGMADAALAASLFHFKELEIKEVKNYLRQEGISVRL